MHLAPVQQDQGLQIVIIIPAAIARASTPGRQEEMTGLQLSDLCEKRLPVWVFLSAPTAQRMESKWARTWGKCGYSLK